MSDRFIALLIAAGPYLLDVPAIELFLQHYTHRFVAYFHLKQIDNPSPIEGTLQTLVPQILIRLVTLNLKFVLAIFGPS